MLFSANGKTIVMTKEEEIPEHVVVPEGTEMIAEDAFSYRKRIRSVSLPASLRQIGHAAFRRCNNLEEVTIANDTLSISGQAFASTPWFDRQPPGAIYLGSLAFDCHGMNPELRIREGTKRVIIPKWFSSDGCNLKGIKKMVLPASVTEFQTTIRNAGPTLIACRTLEAYEVSPDNPCYSSCKGLLYNKSGSRLLICPSACQTIIIPDHVTEIADEAFHYTYQVKELHVPQRLKERYPRLTLKSVNVGPGWEILDESEF